jgi:2-(1,2-epoxy-1,2-dihydrophenyl)acetyl-CoA isomerase
VRWPTISEDRNDRSAESVVRLGIEGGLATITLARGPKSNAIDPSVAKQQDDAVTACADLDASVRCVLIRAEGKNFCAGEQVKDMLDGAEAAVELSDYTTSRLNRIDRTLSEFPAPVASAVQGYAVGGGLGLTCAADLIVGGDSTKFLSGPTKIGLGPDSGVSYSLVRMIGERLTLDMIFTNRIIEAEEALQVGLASRVVPDAELEATATELARGLAAGPTLAFAASKRMVRSDGSLTENLIDEAETLRRLCLSPDGQEGVTAQLERRQPRFGGRR